MSSLRAQILFKEQIQSNFNNAAISYDCYAHVQQKAAQALFTLIVKHKINPKIIIDVGCGTGFLSSKLLNEFSAANFILNDISSNMLTVSRNKFTSFDNVTYHHAGAENVYFNCDNIDLITANLSFQWFMGLKEGIVNLWKQTDRLAFSIPVQNTFEKWQHAHQELGIKCLGKSYVFKKQLMNFCLELSGGNASFKHQVEEVFFENPLDFLKSLKGIGAHSSEIKYSYTDLKKLLNHFPNGITVNYNIMHVFMQKKMS